MDWGTKKGAYMKNKVVTMLMRSRCKIPLQLQLFAEEGDGAGAGGGNGGGSGGGNGASDSDGNDQGNNDGQGGDSGSKKTSFDDFLKDGSNQAEFDRRVQKAIDTAVSKAQEKWKILADDKATEAEKLAKMTAAEKQAYLQQKKEKELADREANITKRELMATAKNTLTDKKLPLELAEILDYSDADSCNKSIEKVEKAFSEAVEAAVKERLKGDDPMKRGNSSKGATLEQQVENAIKTGLY